MYIYFVSICFHIVPSLSVGKCIKAQAWWAVQKHPTDGLLLPIALYTFLFGLHGTLLWCGASHRKSKTGCDHLRGQVPAHSHFSVFGKLLMVCPFRLSYVSFSPHTSINSLLSTINQHYSYVTVSWQC